MTNLTPKEHLTNRRAVAPVIATLLMVAIAVVGGTIIFVFSQGFFSSAQISGAPQIESVEYLGYDLGDVTELTLHDGLGSGTTDQNLNTDGLVAGDRIAVYVQNQSAQRVTLVELSLAGTIYNYTAGDGSLGNFDDFADGNFQIVDRGDDTPGPAVTTTDAIPTLEAGQEATIMMQLDRSISLGRDVQIKMETGNGAIFVGTLIAGQQSG